MLPSILTSTKQRISKTAKRGVSKTGCQQNKASTQQENSTTEGLQNSTTGKQEGHEFKTPRLLDVSTYWSQYVSQYGLQSVSTEVRHSDAFPRLQHPTGLFILTDFVPDAGFGNGRFASSDWPANKRERDMIFDPFFWGGQKHYMFCPRQAVFSVTRNRFRNRKQLARKGGWKTPPKSSFFTGHPVCRSEFRFFKMSSPSPPAIRSNGARKPTW